jgi:two-component system, NtrC family, sensor kinase
VSEGFSAKEKRRMESSIIALTSIGCLVFIIVGQAILARVYSRSLPEIALSSVVSFIAASVGIGIFWLAFTKVISPLRSVEAAIRAFSEGAEAEGAEDLLPKAGPFGLGFIAAEVGGLMRKTRGWKHELEDRTASHTLEIELRNVLLNILIASEEEEKERGVYASVTTEILRLFKADAMLLAFYDGSKALKAVFNGPGGVSTRVLGSSEIELLESAAAGGEVPESLLGLGIKEGFAFGMVSQQGEQCGYTVIGRKSEPFAPDERGILSNVFFAFANQALMRKRKVREEWVRRETERALRRSEERLRTFFEESKDMIYSSNADDVVASINNAGLALLGIKNRFEVLGRPFSDHVMSREDRHFFLKKLHEQGFVTDYECVFQREDGTTLFGLETASAVKDKGGNIVEVQGIVKDISDRIENEKELWKANLELADANERLKNTQMLMVQHEKLASIGHLAAGIAHEINNPLGFLKSNQSTMSGFLRTMRLAWAEGSATDPVSHGEIAKRLDLDYVFEETDTLLRESDEGFQRIIDIVKNLRSFARTEAEPIMGPYDVNKGIESSLVVARNEIKYVADVELDFGELPPIMALGGEVNQVILNLLVNSAQAIEAQKRGDRGRIRVTTKLEEEKVLIVIEDDGPGIPEENMLKVFDPFFTTKEPGKGTGLGLSISYDIIVRKHGGTINIAKSPLGGAAFTISLFVQRPHESQEA